ncbi:MAG: tetratricopeptide repeat protein [Flavobacteriales bacterium]|nr:tetratricopeptide repeat protein [Flavobacteriales bacterium]
MNGRQRSIGAVALILVCTIAAMFPTLLNGWTSWDDKVYVLDNALIQHLSWANLKAIFTTLEVNGTYSPLVLLSWAANYWIEGNSPFGYHLLNLLLHAANAVLVFLFVRRLSESLTVATLAALLFGIHPMNVEPVAWITGRKDVLYAFFSLLSLTTYVKYAQQGFKNRSLVFWSCLFLLFALLSKATAVVVPIWMLLIDLRFADRLNKKILLQKLPFLSLAGVFGLLAIYAQQQTPALSTAIDRSFLHSILSAGYSHLMYFLKALFPFQLAAFHPYPKEGITTDLLSWFGLILWLGTAFASAFWFSKNKRSLTAFGVLFFLIGIFPVSQIIPVGEAVLADRYAYLPYIGLFVASVVFLERLMNRNGIKPMLIQVTILGYAFWLGFSSFQTARTWENDDTLWTNVMRIYPDCAKAYVNRGSYCANRNETELALLDMEKALSLNPNMLELHQQLGLLYQRLERFDDAERSFTNALKLDPTYEPALLNRALNFAYLGNLEKAITDLTLVTVVNESNSLAYLNRGVLYEQVGAMNLAMADYTKVVELKPLEHEGFQYRAVLNFRTGDLNQALQDALKWEDLRPKDAKAQRWLARIYFKLDDLELARTHARRAAELGGPLEPQELEQLGTDQR